MDILSYALQNLKNNDDVYVKYGETTQKGKLKISNIRFIKSQINDYKNLMENGTTTTLDIMNEKLMARIRTVVQIELDNGETIKGQALNDISISNVNNPT